MKKAITILIFFVLLIGLTACIKSSGSSDNSLDESPYWQITATANVLGTEGARYFQIQLTAQAAQEEGQQWTRENQ